MTVNTSKEFAPMSLFFITLAGAAVGSFLGFFAAMVALFSVALLGFAAVNFFCD